MAIKKTIQIGDIKLHQKTPKVLISDVSRSSFATKVANLRDTMRNASLIGMAAPQIGVMERFFITEIRKTKYRTSGTDPLRVFVNPEITWSSKKEVKLYEGCGSINMGNLFGEVRRPEKVEVTYHDEKGEKRTDKFDGILARVIQHEIDHLDGILFTEKLTDPKTLMDREHYLEMMRHGN